MKNIKLGILLGLLVSCSVEAMLRYTQQQIMTAKYFRDRADNLYSKNPSNFVLKRILNNLPEKDSINEQNCHTVIANIRPLLFVGNTFFCERLTCALQRNMPNFSMEWSWNPFRSATNVMYLFGNACSIPFRIFSTIFKESKDITSDSIVSLYWKDSLWALGGYACADTVIRSTRSNIAAAVLSPLYIALPLMSLWVKKRWDASSLLYKALYDAERENEELHRRNQEVEDNNIVLQEQHVQELQSRERQVLRNRLDQHLLGRQHAERMRLEQEEVMLVLQGRLREQEDILQRQTESYQNLSQQFQAQTEYGQTLQTQLNENIAYMRTLQIELEKSKEQQIKIYRQQMLRELAHKFQGDVVALQQEQLTEQQEKIDRHVLQLHERNQVLQNIERQVAMQTCENSDLLSQLDKQAQTVCALQTQVQQLRDKVSSMQQLSQSEKVAEGDEHAPGDYITKLLFSTSIVPGSHERKVDRPTHLTLHHARPSEVLRSSFSQPGLRNSKGAVISSFVPFGQSFQTTPVVYPREAQQSSQEFADPTNFSSITDVLRRQVVASTAAVAHGLKKFPK